MELARHAPGKALLVPAIERIFVVTEDDLTGKLMEAFDVGLLAGVERRIAPSSSGTLAEAIAAEPGDRIIERRLPGLVWRFCPLADRMPLLDKALSARRKIKDIGMRKPIGRAIVPIAESYLHLYKAQSDLAYKILETLYRK